MLADATNRMRVAQEEIFGPVAVIVPFDTEQDAVAMANDNRFALGAGVWTRDLARGHRVADRITAGMVWVNDHHRLEPSLPWGGVKESGTGKDAGTESFDDFTWIKTVVVRTAEDDVDWYGQADSRPAELISVTRSDQSGPAPPAFPPLLCRWRLPGCRRRTKEFLMTADLSRAPAGGWRTEITRMQWLVLLGTTLGWALDGFAGSLYALVLGPAMTELLPNSGIARAPANIGLYGGLTVALFLAGWATGGILFGMLADYFGRTRVLSIGILTYAVFTAAAAFADTWWQLGILRFIAGLGSGVEAPVGAALIAEVWRNRYRAKACGVMMSGYAAGFFIAALAYALLGTTWLAADARPRGGPGHPGLVHPPVCPGAAGNHLRDHRPPQPETTGPGVRTGPFRPAPAADAAIPAQHLDLHRAGHRIADRVLERVHLVPADHPVGGRGRLAQSSTTVTTASRLPRCSSTPAASWATRPGASSPTPSAGGRPSRSVSRSRRSALSTCSRSSGATPNS